MPEAPRPLLVIGNKVYSSWSLRPWLALRMAGVDFEELRIPLYKPGSRAALLRHSPAGKVPILRDGTVTVWESLAICEYAAERAPAAGLWPADPATRAHARAISAEMHAGFAALRAALPMNLRAAGARLAIEPGAQAEIDRVIAIWEDCRARHAAAGPFLFGAFSIADAMFAPVVSRFRSYSVPAPPASRAWAEAVWALPAFEQWRADAAGEVERFAAIDALAEARS